MNKNKVEIIIIKMTKNQLLKKVVSIEEIRHHHKNDKYILEQCESINALFPEVPITFGILLDLHKWNNIGAGFGYAIQEAVKKPVDVTELNFLKNKK